MKRTASSPAGWRPTPGDLVCITYKMVSNDPPIGSVWVVVRKEGQGHHISVRPNSPTWMSDDQLRPTTPEELAAYQLASLEAGL